MEKKLLSKLAIAIAIVAFVVAIIGFFRPDLAPLKQRVSQLERRSEQPANALIE